MLHPEMLSIKLVYLYYISNRLLRAEISNKESFLVTLRQFCLAD